MKFTETFIKDLFLIEPAVLSDERGSFFRTYCENEFEAIGFKGKWVQANQSITKTKGTIRGLHYQHPPFAESKLIRCIRGSVFDVIIDLRKNSGTFLKYYSVELSESNHYSLLVPEGCAHGFQTLEDNCQMMYFHSQFYAPKHEAGVRYNDTVINIKWPLMMSEMSDRDKNFPGLTNEFKGV